jgi:hypothetical protein
MRKAGSDAAKDAGMHGLEKLFEKGVNEAKRRQQGARNDSRAHLARPGTISSTPRPKGPFEAPASPTEKIRKQWTTDDSHN